MSEAVTQTRIGAALLHLHNSDASDVLGRIQALDTVREMQAVLAAKDAEIERLTDKVEGLEADFNSVLTKLWQRGGDRGRVWIINNYPKFKSPE